MNKPKSIIEEVKTEVKNKQKELKTMKNQSLKETVKTIVITILATILLTAPAFIYVGLKYEQSNSERITTTAKSMSQIVKTDAPLKQ